MEWYKQPKHNNCTSEICILFQNFLWIQNFRASDIKYGNQLRTIMWLVCDIKRVWKMMKSPNVESILQVGNIWTFVCQSARVVKSPLELRSSWTLNYNSTNNIPVLGSMLFAREIPTKHTNLPLHHCSSLYTFIRNWFWSTLIWNWSHPPLIWSQRCVWSIET